MTLPFSLKDFFNPLDAQIGRGQEDVELDRAINKYPGRERFYDEGGPQGGEPFENVRKPGLQNVQYKIYEGEVKPLASTDAPQKFVPYSGEVTSPTAAAESPKAPSWKDVPGQAFAHLLPSALEAGKSLIQPIIHPVDTLHNLKRLGQGLATYTADPEIAGATARAGGDVEKTYKEAQTAAQEKYGGPVRQLAKFYGERYGSEEGFKKALSEDPVGVAMDIGTVLSAGEMAGAKVPLLAKIADPARAARAVGKVGKATETVASETLGHLTGGGAESVRQSVKAGFNREKQFIDALDGKLPLEQTVKLAERGIANMRKQRNANYQTLMQTVKADPAVLDYNKVLQAWQDAQKYGHYEGVPLYERTAGLDTKVINLLEKWHNLGTSDPQKFWSPAGLDALKKAVRGMKEGISPTAPNARIDIAYLGNLERTIKAQITEQAPIYEKVMKDYHEASDGLEEIERALSLGDRAMYDSGIRKMLSAMRNNANSNYGNRLRMIDKLEEHGAKGLKSTLAGAQMSSMFPRGLAGRNPFYTALAALVSGHPGALAALPFEMPKVIGRRGYQLGGIGREFSDLAQSTIIPANMPPINPDALSRILYYMGQQNERQ